MESTLVIRKWGNNLGVRLPVAISKEAGFQSGQKVRLRVEDGRVIVEPVPPADLGLEDRLRRFDPARHGGEAMADARVGAEQW